MFGVQLYKNNARALLSRILSILNLDWLQHARSVRVVYECAIWYEAYVGGQEEAGYVDQVGINCSSSVAEQLEN